MSTPGLVQTLGFTEADPNHSGRFSEEQKQRLARDEGGVRGSALGMGIFLVVIALLGPAIAAGVGLINGREHLAMAVGFGLGFGLLWPLMYGFAACSARPIRASGRWKDLSILSRWSAELQSIHEHNSEYSVCELRIGGHVFEVGAGVPSQMMQDDVYAVYFAYLGSAGKPKTLSAEWLSTVEKIQSRMLHEPLAGALCCH